MRHLLLSLLALTLVVAGCAAPSGRQRLTEQQSGGEVLVDTGEQLEVRLSSNPSTGYSWRLDADLPLRHLVVVSWSSEQPDEPSDDHLVGVPGVEVIVLEATSTGAEVLRLEYVRPFDDPILPERIAEFVVRVDGAEMTPPPGPPPTPSTATAPD